MNVNIELENLRLENSKLYFWKLFNLNLNVQKPRNFNQVWSFNQFTILCNLFFGSYEY